MPAAIIIYKPILSSERILHKDYNRKCSIAKNTGHDLKWLGAKTK
jgi:hypothetical protein